jgi:hypothetical protein
MCSDARMPVDAPSYYFEMTIDAFTPTPKVSTLIASIGVLPAASATATLSQWPPRSYRYQVRLMLCGVRVASSPRRNQANARATIVDADDVATSREFASSYSVGDTVGVQWDRNAREIACTRNGRMLGVMANNVPAVASAIASLSVLPAIGVGVGVRVTVNFGQVCVLRR